MMQLLVAADCCMQNFRPHSHLRQLLSALILVMTLAVVGYDDIDFPHPKVIDVAFFCAAFVV